MLKCMLMLKYAFGNSEQTLHLVLIDHVSLALLFCHFKLFLSLPGLAR